MKIIAVIAILLALPACAADKLKIVDPPPRDAPAQVCLTPDELQRLVAAEIARAEAADALNKVAKAFAPPKVGETAK